MKTYVLLFSLGRTSAFLANYFKIKHGFNKTVSVFYTKGKPMYKYHTNDKGDRLFVLCMNTGKERKESLTFGKRCNDEFDLNVILLEAEIKQGKGNVTGFNITTFDKASTDGKPFEDMLKKYPMPHNRGVSNCTRELKQRPKEQFMKWIGCKDYISVVGIRADEAHRKSNNAEKERNIYPLADEFKVNSQFIRNWWERQNFDLELKDYEGNCDLCFKKSLKKRLTLINENPDIATWWAKMEDTYADEYIVMEGDYEYDYDEENGITEQVTVYDKRKEVVKKRYFDTRAGLSIHDLVDMASKPFDKAEDLHLLSKKQQGLFEIETDCFCKAT